MMKLKLIVTGTGRCGTVFLARWLTSLGMPCGHESIYDYRGLEAAKRRLSGEEKVCLSFCSTTKRDEEGKWHSIPEWLKDLNDIVADSSYMAAPHLEHIECPILHVVRHPSKVINSFCNYIDYFTSHEPQNVYEQFIYKTLPELTHEMPQYDRAALYYVLWNRMIEPYAGLRWDIEGNPNVVMNWLGIKGEVFEDKSINTFKKPAKRFAIRDIQSNDIKNQLIEICRSYNYSCLENLMA